MNVMSEIMIDDLFRQIFKYCAAAQMVGSPANNKTIIGNFAKRFGDKLPNLIQQVTMVKLLLM